MLGQGDIVADTFKGVVMNDLAIAALPQPQVRLIRVALGKAALKIQLKKRRPEGENETKLHVNALVLKFDIIG